MCIAKYSVNPEGVFGDPVPSKSASQIREVFGRMDMNDSETVALVGGGHAFGKSHGACPLGAGDNPETAPYDPWPGNCGTGKGEDTFTSGFEGQWTTYPFQWDNEYFTQLYDYAYGEVDYELVTGDGGKYQWVNSQNGYMMLTADLAFTEDDAYLDIVTEFAENIDSLNNAFSAAWEKLTTSGGKWADNKHCMSGADVEEALATTSTPIVIESSFVEGDGASNPSLISSLVFMFIALYIFV